MKLIALKFLVSIFFVLAAFLIVSCNKDKTDPIITIIGSNPDFSCLGEDYQDAGAIAMDDEDGDLTDEIETIINVNISVEGTNSVTYMVEDKAGNKATATRTVNVDYCK